MSEHVSSSADRSRGTSGSASVGESAEQVGLVAGTEDSTPLQFAVALDEASYLQLDDVVVTLRHVPGRGPALTSGRRGDGDGCARGRRDDRWRRGRDRRRGALADRLARAPSFLRPVRDAERRHLGRMDAALPELQRAPLSPRRPGRDHAGGEGRAVPARPRAAAARRPVLLPRRIYGARRNPRGGGAP